MKTITISTQYADRGATPLSVSELVYGAAKFGDFTKEAENFGMLDQWRSVGGTFIDTALVYGTWIDQTHLPYSEIILGRWLDKQSDGDKFVIATKGAHYRLKDRTPRVNAEAIREDIAQSVTHFTKKPIDIYILHRDDENMPVSEIMDELNRHTEKEINLLGASNWTAARIYKANDYCEKHNLRGFDVSQICYNIMRITPEQIGDTTLVSMTDEEWKEYCGLGVTVMAFTSQAGGYVSKFYDTPDAAVKSKYACEKSHKRMKKIREVCERTGLTPTGITLAYLRSQPFPVIPIVGASKKEQLSDCAANAECRLSTEDLLYLQ